MIKFPACERHQGYACQFINLQVGRVKLVCGECLYSSLDQQSKVDYSQIISIEQALNQPEILLQKLTGQEKFSHFFVNMSKHNGFEFTHLVNQLESLVTLCQNYFIEMLEKIKSHIALGIQSRAEIKQKILDKIQYLKFNDLLKELVNENRQYECQQLEMRLSNMLRKYNKTMVQIKIQQK